MSLVSSLNVGVSALRSYAEGIQVVSNNIANVNTVGYKTSQAQYADTFSNILKPLVPNEKGVAVKIPPTQVGGGVQVESVSPVFSQGTIQVTNSNSDLAVAGNGFFRVRNAQSGQEYVTRAGNFRVDADGNFVTQQGYHVQGAVGAHTKVIYDGITGSYNVLGPQDNPRVTVPAGMTPVTVTGFTTTGQSNVISIPISSPGVSTLKVGMTITSSSDVSGSAPIPSGSQILNISRNGTSVDITLSKKAFSGSTTATINTSDMTVDSNSNVLTFPPDPNRPSISLNTPIIGAGLPPGTVIQSATGNFITGLDSAPSPFSVNGPSTPVSSGSTITLLYSSFTPEQLSRIKGMLVTTTSTGALVNGVYVSDYTVNSPASGPQTVTLTLSTPPPSTATPLTGNASIDSNAKLSFLGQKTIDPAVGAIRVNDATGIHVGDSVAGQGIPAADPNYGLVVVADIGVSDNGTPPSKVANADGTWTITLGYKNDPNVGNSNRVPVFPTSTSQDATKFAFGNQVVTLNNLPLVDSFDSITFSIGTEYQQAKTIGDLKVSFDQGSDYDFYGTDGRLLTGIQLAAAQASAPRIRTFNVGNDGSVNVILSNGQTYQSGSVLLQSFKDPGALIREGDNLFSGLTTAGPYNGPWNKDNITNLTPSVKGLGSINGGALELSNVDLGEQFATMITTQRAFQAGSRVITTTDQMLEEAVNLKR
jgi:flagellar hook protein FlgE